MSRKIFVSLPVADLARSRAFYEAVGFTVNDLFSDETSACLELSETIYVMIMTHSKMADFSKLPIGDPAQQTQHLLALSCEDKTEVDDFLARALTGGGVQVHPPEDLGFMYSVAFTDPDGHGWGPFWMDPTAAVSGPTDMG